MSTGIFKIGKIPIKIDIQPQLRFSEYLFEILEYSVLLKIIIALLTSKDTRMDYEVIPT